MSADQYEFEAFIDGLKVFVDKIGGGTLDRSYIGDWDITVMNGDEYVIDAEILHTGMPKTHLGVAVMAVDFASEQIDGV